MAFLSPVKPLLLILLIKGVNCWRCAKYENYFSQQPDYIDCLWDCCGNSFNRHCCAPIGIIVGCCIVGAMVVAFLSVLLLCWWQRRRAKESQGPRLFHNQRHSHYPVAPTSVTRPAPMFSGPEPDQEFKRPPEDEFGHPAKAGYRPGPPQGYRPGPPQGYRPGPPQGYRPPLRSEKPPLDEYYDDRPQKEFRPGPPLAGYQQPYQGSQRSEKIPLDSDSSERAIDI